jgi:hypothetical protein
MKQIDFYIQEAIAQAEYALTAYNEYESALLSANINLVFYHLHHFVLHVTNVDKLLFPQNKPFRSTILKSVQVKVQNEISSMRRLRNHLEHFDERLDIYVKNYTGQAFFDCNVITGVQGFPAKDFLRVIDGNTYRFYGENFDLNEIHNRLSPLIKSLKDTQNSV